MAVGVGVCPDKVRRILPLLLTNSSNFLGDNAGPSPADDSVHQHSLLALLSGTFGFGRKENYMVVYSFAMLKQRELLILWRLEGDLEASTCMQISDSRIPDAMR